MMARERLGGRCARCDATEGLQFDHITPGSRARKVSEATNWAMERFLAEVDKCQLLCDPCHRAKSSEAGEVAIGERQGTARLTEAEVREILMSPLSSRRLAMKYGVSKTTIRDVCLRKTWKRVILDLAG